MVRQRAVMDEAEIKTGRERMGVFGRHRTFGRHSRVAECVRAGPMLEVEALCNRVRQTDILEYLDALTNAECAELGVTTGKPGKEPLLIGADRKNDVAAVPPSRRGKREGGSGLGFERRPNVFDMGCVQC